MQIFMIIIGLFIILISINVIKKEITWILNGIDDSYERARNSIKECPRKYGDELSRQEKIINIILTILFGTMFLCSGLAMLFFAISSIVNYL